jgi:hypothetical protein
MSAKGASCGTLISAPSGSASKESRALAILAILSFGQCDALGRRTGTR